MMEAGRASLLVKRNGEPILTIEAAAGIRPSVIPSISVPIGYGIAGFVALRGTTLLGRFANETFLSVPVPTSQGIEGVLNLTERFGGRPFTPDDLASTHLMVRHIGRVLEYRRESNIDPASGLPNRRAFAEALERELTRGERTGSHFTLVFLDVDGLKWVNDNYGHAKGDELIRNVAQALKETVRPYDLAARWGGDEFAVLLADTHDGHESIVERLVRSSSVGPLQEPGHFSVSIGIARYPEDGPDASTLTRMADSRMYAYKKSHPNRYRRRETDQP